MLYKDQSLIHSLGIKTAIIGFYILIFGFYLAPDYKVQSQLFYILILLPFLIIGWKDLWQLIQDHRLMQLVTVFIIYLAISSLWSGADAKKPSYKGAVYAIYIFALLWSMLHSARDFVTQLKKPLSATAICAIALLSALASITADLIGFGEIRIDGRMVNVFSIENLNYYAHAMGWAFILCAYCFTKASVNILKGLFAAGALVTLSACLFMQTRASVIGLVAVFITILLLHSLQSKVKFYRTLGLGGLALACTLWFGHENLERFFNLVNLQDDIRYKIFLSVLESLSGSYWFGHGLLAPTNEVSLGFGYPHSMYLYTLYTTGFVGLGLQFAVIVCTCITAIRHIQIPLVKLSLLLFVYGCSTLLFDGFSLLDHVNINWLLFWVPLGMMIAALSNLKVGKIKQ